jgi:hypothetical protein
MAKRSRADVKYAIDLLWTHQIRRENLQLHKEVQHLQQSIDEYLRKHEAIKEIAQNAENSATDASMAIRLASSRIQDLHARLEQTQSLAGATSQQTSDISKLVDSLQEDWRSTAANLNCRVDQNQANLQHAQSQHDHAVSLFGTRLAKVHELLESKVDDESIESLHLRIQALEQQPLQHWSGSAALSHVSESIEPHGRRYEASLQDVEQHSRNENTGAETPVEEEEYMLTMRDIAKRDSSVNEEFDLDANVSVPSYAVSAHRQPHNRDSLQPIAPTCSSDAQLRTEIFSLKQGRYHSHDRYLAEGQSLMDRIPEGQERLLIESFVNGLYLADDREQCRQLLERQGWRWAIITTLFLPSTPTAPALTAVAGVNDGELASHTTRQHKQLVPQPKSANAQKHTQQNSQAPDAAQDGPLIQDQLRRSSPIAASQHPHKKATQQTTSPRLFAALNANNAESRDPAILLSPRKNRSSLERPWLGASDLRRIPSTSTTRPGQLGRRMSPATERRCPGDRPKNAGEQHRTVETRMPTTPQKTINAVRKISRGDRARTERGKRRGPHEWLTTESDSGISTESDDVQLPINLSPELGPRKRRRRNHHYNRSVALPPPEIPILSTSE